MMVMKIRMQILRKIAIFVVKPKNMHEKDDVQVDDHDDDPMKREGLSRCVSSLVISLD